MHFSKNTLFSDNARYIYYVTDTMATRCTNLFFILTNCRKVSQLRLNARKQYQKHELRMREPIVFLLGCLREITTNKILFEHDKILQTVLKK